MMKKALVITCDKCGATDILEKKSDGPSNFTDSEGYEVFHPGWCVVQRFARISRPEKRYLCPSCSKKYTDMVESFWKEN